MSKVVLQKAGYDYYIIPDFGTPKYNLSPFTTSCTTSYDNSVSTMSYNVNINNIPFEPCKSNKELVNEMLTELDESDVTAIESLSGNYRILIEYNITDENNCVVDHSSILEDVEPKFAMIPLGVNEENECVYRLCSVFNVKAVINSSKKIPVGVSKSSSSSYNLRLVSLSIYQAKSELDNVKGANNSVYGNCYCPKSLTLNQIIQGSALIFSTSTESMCFSPASMSSIPRRININIKISNGNIMAVYDSETIKSILQKNVDDRNNIESGDHIIIDGTGTSCDGATVIVDWIEELDESSL